MDIKDTEGHFRLREKIMDDFSAFVYAPIAEKFDLIEVDEVTEPNEDRA